MHVLRMLHIFLVYMWENRKEIMPGLILSLDWHLQNQDQWHTVPNNCYL